MTYNWDEFSYNDWIKFVFDHPVLDKTGLTYEQPHWYFQKEWDYNSGNKTRLAEFCTKLFNDPVFLKEKYSWEQIEEGSWFLMNEIVLYLLHEPNVAWPIRNKFIESMASLYKKLFVDNPLTIASFMWWDGICYDYYMKKGVVENEDERNVQNAAFETLKRILNIESLKCQLAALHGMGHVMHKDTAVIINGYLDKNPQLSERAKAYAKGCIEGTMDRMGDPNFEKGGPKEDGI